MYLYEQRKTKLKVYMLFSLFLVIVKIQKSPCLLGVLCYLLHFQRCVCQHGHQQPRGGHPEGRCPHPGRQHGPETLAASDLLTGLYPTL